VRSFAYFSHLSLILWPAEEEQPSQGQSLSLASLPAPDVALSGQAGPSDLAVTGPVVAAPEAPAQDASTSDGSAALANAVADAVSCSTLPLIISYLLFIYRCVPSINKYNRLNQNWSNFLF
jgi:hypothetical protein